MLYVAISRRLPGADLALLKSLAAEETLAVWALHVEGPVRAIHFDAERSTGILTIEAASRDAARSALDALPMVAQRLIGFDVYALGPYRALGSLGAGAAR